VVRRMADDGVRYFGPYHSAAACRQTLRLINRHFQLRTCTDRVLASRQRVCLQYQIKRCPGPCVYPVDADQYAQQVRDVTLFLEGSGEELIQDLEGRMREAAGSLKFERAARIRDQIAALRTSLQRQQVVSESQEDQDIFGFHREGEDVDLVVLIVRQGKLVGRRAFSFAGQAFPDEEVLSAVVSRFYDRGEPVPGQVLVPLPLEDATAKRQWLAELRKGAVEIRVPRRGAKRRLLDLALHNARSNFATRRQRHSDMQQALDKLQRRLRLSRFPHRIECYDVSGFHGQQVVASMTVMLDGEPCPPEYRRFKITSRRKDDFAAMYEVLSRRLRRAREGDKGWDLPDLIVVDGGKAQLSMARAALRDVGLPDGASPPDLAALAKERTPAEEPGRVAADAKPDRVFIHNVKDPVWLRPNTAELFLLARVRDEAHRFAITFHKALRQRKTLRSGLEDIPGIGPKRRKGLLKSLGSLKRIRSASVEELAAAPGMSARAAEAVAQYFASTPAPDKGEDPGHS